MLINLIRQLLQKILEDLDSGNSNISEQEQLQLLELLQKFNRTELSKLESASYIGISRATFDNYIKQGKLPQGNKRQGFKELSWNKVDLDKFISKRDT